GVQATPSSKKAPWRGQGSCSTAAGGAVVLDAARKQAVSSGGSHAGQPESSCGRGYGCRSEWESFLPTEPGRGNRKRRGWCFTCQNNGAGNVTEYMDDGSHR